MTTSSSPALPFVLLLGVALALVPRAADARSNVRAEEPRPREQLLILPLELDDGAGAERLRKVEDAFRAEVEALGRYRVARPEVAALLLDSVRSMGLDCGAGDLECLTKAGVVMEIDLLAVLRAAVSEERLILSAVLVDVQRGRTRASVHRSLPRDESPAAAGREVAVELLAPDLFVGSLLLEVSEAGASVRVDGVPRGTTPLAAIEGLAPGEHVLHVEKRGFEPVERLVVVGPLATRKVSVALAPVGTSTVPAPKAPASDASDVIDTAREDAPDAKPPSPSASGAARAEGTAPDAAVDAIGDAAPRDAGRPAPLLPLVLGSGAAALSLVTAGAVVGALVMTVRMEDARLSPAERERARELLGGLLVAGLAASAASTGAAIASGVAWFSE